uniref:EF-hand domain-containing protein n=2 Tax=Cryptomonas curvata TaxID=233186 RepID=A0A7S0MSV9_9CRYP|mmetsp:Transcript_53468/g.111614  ORF Transcript_53468/g.111614 Transcript_53468/m.111614 type:complete len:119 (+) Transcript_53468:241-597(+)
MSKEEAANMFRVMDADGSGTVDFREFASVILHMKQQRATKGKLSFKALAEKIFKLFDKTGDGRVSVDEISETVSALGKNWDIASVQFFFSQVDKDGSGEITKSEFIEFMDKLSQEISV